MRGSPAGGVTPPEYAPGIPTPESRPLEAPGDFLELPVVAFLACLDERAVSPPHAVIVTITAKGRSTPTTATTNMVIYRPDLKCEEDSAGIEPATGRSPTFDRDYPNADDCSDSSVRWFASQGPGREADNCIEQVEQSPH